MLGGTVYNMSYQLEMVGLLGCWVILGFDKNWLGLRLWVCLIEGGFCWGEQEVCDGGRGGEGAGVHPG